MDRMMEVRTGVCVKCKQIMYNRAGKDFCEACETAMKRDAENVAARLKKTWYLAAKRT